MSRSNSIRCTLDQIDTLCAVSLDWGIILHALQSYPKETKETKPAREHAVEWKGFDGTPILRNFLSLESYATVSTGVFDLMKKWADRHVT